MASIFDKPSLPNIFGPNLFEEDIIEYDQAPFFPKIEPVVTERYDLPDRNIQH